MAGPDAIRRPTSRFSAQHKHDRREHDEPDPDRDARREPGVGARLEHDRSDNYDGPAISRTGDVGIDSFGATSHGAPQCCRFPGVAVDYRYAVPRRSTSVGRLVHRRAQRCRRRGDVAVYLPMSYQIRGYTVFLPRKRVKQVDMSREDAMRFVLMAGLKSKSPGKGAREKPA